MKTAIVLFADGFEECEGLLVVDLLRRAGVQVVTASIMGRREIVSSHQITLLADILAEEADFDAADLLVLPSYEAVRRTEHAAAGIGAIEDNKQKRSNFQGYEYQEVAITEQYLQQVLHTAVSF